MLKSIKISIVILVGILFIWSPARAETSSSSTSEDEPWAVSSTSVYGATDAPQEAAAPAEPIIRVKIYQTKDPVKFSSPFAYAVYSGEEAKGVLPVEEMGKLSYHTGVYAFTSKSLDFKSPDYVRLVPDDPTSYFSILGYKRQMPGRKTNYNTYRGTLEYVFSPKSAELYIVNELPMEEYVAGLGEASNGSAVEYLKALAVAGRTYAYMMLGPRSAKHLFDVYASTIDQLYLGYNSEIAMPRVAASALDTSGIIVTYNGAPVITNYFAHSNGLTKTWDGRGFGSRPWMESVEAPYDVGKKMSGHGYGMSCNDAIMRAQKDGWSYDAILSYYYSHTDVTRMY